MIVPFKEHNILYYLDILTRSNNTKGKNNLLVGLVHINEKKYYTSTIIDKLWL